jgi:hypothetical protein
LCFRRRRLGHGGGAGLRHGSDGLYGLGRHHVDAPHRELSGGGIRLHLHHGAGLGLRWPKGIRRHDHPDAIDHPAAIGGGLKLALQLHLGLAALLEDFLGLLVPRLGQELLIVRTGCFAQGEGQAHFLCGALHGIEHIAG